jgi:iron(III) transport system substrate-binding protein
MRKRSLIPMAGIVAVAMFVAGCGNSSSSNAAAAKTVNGEFAALQAMPKDQAQQKLVQEANKEGSVNWYTVTHGSDADDLAKAFEKAYPGIKVNVTRSNEPGVANTFNTETRAKHYNVDLLDDDVTYMDQFHDSGLLANIPSFGLDVPKANHGDWWVVLSLQPSAIAWNTNLVPAADAPKTYQDLLDPKWKGKLVIDISPESTVQSLMVKMGKDKATQFFTQLMNQQQPEVLQSHSQIDQLLAAGKYAVCVECFAYDVADLRDSKHAPVNFVLPDPTPTPVSPDAIAAHAPHPYAALLLMNFLASKPGADVLSGLGRITQTADVNLKTPALNQIRDASTLFLCTPPNVGAVTKDAEDLVNKLVAAKVAGGSG